MIPVEMEAERFLNDLIEASESLDSLSGIISSAKAGAYGKLNHLFLANLEDLVQFLIICHNILIRRIDTLKPEDVIEGYVKP